MISNVPPSRAQLLLEFDMQRQAAEKNGSHPQGYFLCDRYPPSTRPIADLHPITIANLEIEIHHKGSVIFVRTIDEAIKSAAVHSIVEDDSGKVTRLSLFNVDPSQRIQDVLPESAVFAIKEPYFTTSASGSPTIRVDHPSDVIWLLPLSAWIPVSLRDDSVIQKSLSDLKDEGNAAFKAKDYLVAQRAYSQGIGLCCEADLSMKGALLRNRATANIYLQRFEQAMADSAAAVCLETDRNDGSVLLAKSLYQAGRAAYELRRFQEAKSWFCRAAEVDPDYCTAVNQSRCAKDRLKEQYTGRYDFAAMSRSATKNHHRLDHADFVSNTVVKDAGSHGKGLFATKSLAAGELILCEKALCMAFDSDRDAKMPYDIFDPVKKRRFTGTKAILAVRIISKLLYSPTLASKLTCLGGGLPKERGGKHDLDGLVPIDSFQVQDITHLNCYGCPSVKSSMASTSRTSAGHSSTGLWAQASRINHACNGNAMRAFIGDMMIVRATRDITEGEEILMPYRLPHVDKAITQTEIERAWGFRCDCALCMAEAQSSSRQCRNRVQLTADLEALINADQKLPNASSARVEAAYLRTLCTKLEATYPMPAFATMPRLALVVPQLLLCKSYGQAGLWKELLETASSLLRNMGYIVTLGDEGVNIDRSGCCLQQAAVEAAEYASRAIFETGQADFGKQMEAFAASLYYTMSGDGV